ncbi:MAG TPA: glutathione peroxidase [Usitatibacteraceae bacterium]|nr:glutathione peroxidase [Usitatibacteraceae bacterium]
MSRTLAAALLWVALPAAAACPALLDHRMATIKGEPTDLCQYAGKVVLVVNTASYCGYTGQYEGLEALHQRYRDRGLVVLGVPSNDFGAQEPGSNEQVADFCERTYKVRFPMLAKAVVSGPGAIALYRELAGKTGKAPGWNFHKYLLGRDGQAIASFPSAVPPGDARLVAAVEKALAVR